MNRKLALSCLVVGTLLVPAVSYATDSDSDRAHPETFVKDSAITAKVKAKLASQNLNTLAQIRVDTDRNGKVFLSGTAKTQDAVDRAISVARQTEGVTSVTSAIKVKADD